MSTPPEPLTSQDIDFAISALEAAANDEREPERYRNWYSEALEHFIQYQARLDSDPRRRR